MFHVVPNRLARWVVCAACLVAARAHADSVPATLSVPEDPSEAHEANNIRVFREVAPATVFVTQKQRIRDFWTMTESEVESGSGSGFVWDREGHVVTNFHVVDSNTALVVTLQDGSNHPARFIGGDPNKDIAVLRIDPRSVAGSLVPVSLPPKDEKLLVGQTAIAIGNPFGLDQTLTVGVVSALGREVKGYGGVTIRNMIQTDASINPGNSGGPLLDRKGRLIGMNTMILTKVGQSAGIGFAVPAQTLRRVVPQIIAHGKPRAVGLGIQPVSDALARRAGIRGVIIGSVVPKSPASQAGLRGLRRSRQGTLIGDVIIGIDDQRIEDYDDLYNALDGRDPGTQVQVTMVRDGERRTVPVSLVLLP
jgi:S1-C subfamily serine protease